MPLLFLLAADLLLVGCANEAPAPAPPPASTTVPTLLGDVPGIHFLGNWTSPACGGRSFARNIRFEDHQQYAAIDLVSPCPKGVACAWSGMTAFAGIWVQQGTKLELREIGGPTVPGGPHPTSFEATTDGKLVENGCFYTVGLTVPAGYTEAEVTPRVPGTNPDAPAAALPAPAP